MLVGLFCCVSKSHFFIHIHMQLKKLALEHLSEQAELKIPMLKGLEPEKAGQIFTLLDPVHFLQDEVFSLLTFPYLHPA